ncbi:hypothetical protein Bca101_079737 [Brassica carinata]
MSISPSLSPRQCPDRYAFRAGRNLPDKEFRYLRTVIVTAAVHGLGRGSLSSGHQLQLPSGTGQALLRPSGPTRGSTGIFTCCPSTTPFGLILGPDSPSVVEPCGGTLGFSGHWILTNVCVTQADILASAVHRRSREFSKNLYRDRGPHRNSALPLDVQSTAAPQRISGEPASSGFEWHFTPNHNSSADFSTSVGSDLHLVSPKLHPGHR